MTNMLSVYTLLVMMKISKFAKRLFITLLVLFLIYHQNTLFKTTFDPPKYQNISGIIKKDFLSDDDYLILEQQCGLNKEAIDSVPRETLLDYQKQYIYPFETKTIKANFFIVDELNYQNGKVAYINMMPLETGDLILCFSNSTMMYNHGHSAVYYEGKLLTIESPTKLSGFYDARYLNRLSTVCVLRLKKEYRYLLKDVSCDELLNKPYKFIVNKNSKTYQGGYCSFNSYYFYKRLGLDCDSDGGFIVTPRDLYYSKYFDVIQKYRLN